MSKYFSLFALAALCAAAMTGCTTMSTGGSYSVHAYKPNNPSDVSVRVSLSKQIVYVKEGNRMLMAAACNVGIPSKPTPSGNFHIEGKIPDKRSGTYGFDVHSNSIVATESNKATGRYVGYPMPFWCEFAPEYGFHQGYVWPVPRTHGCIRLDNQVAPRFFELVHIGTPVNISKTQPDDAKYAAIVKRPTDYRDPDPAASYMVSSRVFQKPPGQLLITQ